MTDGIDCALDCTKQVAAIKALNATFVGRYYRLPGSRWTPLSAAEAKVLSNAGLKIVALWEGKSDVLGHFSYPAGVDEGTSAYRQAMNTGQPTGTPIYFAVDFDCPANGITGAVNDYFRGIADGFNTIGNGKPAYSIGVYGSGCTCAWLLGHGRVSYTWLAQSTGWDGYKSFKDWNIKQGRSQKKPFDYDLDEATDNCGAFTV